MTTKMGRPPKADADKRTAHLSVRVSAKLRDMLETERRSAGHSLSNEVSMRLWTSFTATAELEKRFGGAANWTLFQILAERISSIEVAAGGEDRWLDHPFAYQQVRAMIDVVLDAFRPPGNPKVLPKAVRARHPSLIAQARGSGREAARQALDLLEAASREEVPAELPPELYFRAALPLGRRLGRRGKRSANATKGERA